ncbi:MAG TPA: hypothetical protein VEH84_03620 [Alphaproteobacteria bacterium]|nr:hypothetical protein [Alphaproteobacteria bacterium]
MPKPARAVDFLNWSLPPLFIAAAILLPLVGLYSAQPLRPSLAQYVPEIEGIVVYVFSLPAYLTAYAVASELKGGGNRGRFGRWGAWSLLMIAAMATTVFLIFVAAIALYSTILPLASSVNKLLHWKIFVEDWPECLTYGPKVFEFTLIWGLIGSLGWLFGAAYDRSLRFGFAGGGHGRGRVHRLGGALSALAATALPMPFGDVSGRLSEYLAAELLAFACMLIWTLPHLWLAWRAMPDARPAPALSTMLGAALPLGLVPVAVVLGAGWVFR